MNDSEGEKVSAIKLPSGRSYCAVRIAFVWWKKCDICETETRLSWRCPMDEDAPISKVVCASESDESASLGESVVTDVALTYFIHYRS